jgi:hypothetical protein
MGQFNYPQDPDDVVFWYQSGVKSSTIHTVVRMRFQEDLSCSKLTQRSWRGKGVSDQGYYSPIENLARTPAVERVRYRWSQLSTWWCLRFQCTPQFSKEDIVASGVKRYWNIRNCPSRMFELSRIICCRETLPLSILPDGTFRKLTEVFSRIDAGLWSLANGGE